MQQLKVKPHSRATMFFVQRSQPEMWPGVTLGCAAHAGWASTRTNPSFSGLGPARWAEQRQQAREGRGHLSPEALHATGSPPGSCWLGSGLANEGDSTVA